MVYTIEEIKEKVKPIAKKYHVKEMYLFGSYARGQADEKSDIDLAVAGDDTNILLDFFFDFIDELEETFCLPVDVIFIENVYNSPTRFENRFAPRFERDKVKVA
ncbi:hypothetical protein SAMN02745116_01715 [Pilibacter termitis]|uniref:Polymerase beta nucleotidyltransferase domain-containing protein n=1 Tax=Pilibacter termitis TaxID=263852 RepID=A0A1T4P9U9_9ENTE|nr:nucleotidyltransferase domain-containing protein [Pilibacter termitis]SJZ88272.1 hypothetical protein SAMN02745116_01715 [Pilibacter termitis]